MLYEQHHQDFRLSTVGAPIYGNRKRNSPPKRYSKDCFNIFSGLCQSKKSPLKPSLVDAGFGFSETIPEETEDATSTSGSLNCFGFKNNPDRVSDVDPSFRSLRYGHKSADGIHDLSFSNHAPSLSRCTSQYSTYDGFRSRISNFESRKSTAIVLSNSSGEVKPSPSQQNLECTLKELCFGCKKEIRVMRDILIHDWKIIIQEEETLTIKVKPGWTQGTKITFEGGNEKPGISPSDVTFIVTEKEHHLFERKGNDLVMEIKIPLVNALTGCGLSIPLLDEDTINLTIDDVIYPGYEKIVAGQGMPYINEKEKRGDLKIVFLVEFPTKLAHDQQVDIVHILDENSC